MLQLNNVEVRYMNVVLVLRGISMKLREGGVVALLGANGAGKTTTLRAISGLLRTQEGKVTSGTILYHGEHIENAEPETVARRGIIQVLEGHRMFEHLTTEENILAGSFGRAERSTSKTDLDLVYEYFPALKKFRRSTAGYLSGGEQQMAVIARALMSHPKLMLLDEPSLGLAPLLVVHIFEILKQINRLSEGENIGMLLVEQNAHAALSLAEYGYILENGRIVLEGSATDLTNNADVHEFYLGLTRVGERKSYRDVKHYRRRKRWLG